MALGLLGWPLLEGGDPRSPYISHSLGLIQTVSQAGSEFGRSFSDVLEMVQAARRAPTAATLLEQGPATFCIDPMIDVRGYYSFTCTLPQPNTPANVLFASASTLIEMLGSAAAGVEKAAEVSQTLTFTEVISVARAVEVLQALGLSDTIAADLLRLVADTLAMAQAIGLNHDSNISLANALALVQSILNNFELSLTVQQQIILQELITKTAELSLSNALALVQVIQRVHPESFSHALSILEAALINASKASNDAMDIEDTASAQIIANRAFEDDTNLQDGVMLWVQKAGGGTFPDACDTSYINLSNLSEVTFAGTTPAGSFNVTLRAPRLGNVHTLDLSTLARTTRGGIRKVVRPDSWPTVQILKLTFESLTDAKRAALLSFMSNTNGFEVTYTDHEGRSWDGLIITSVADVAQMLRTCAHEISIEFRGSPS